MAPIVTSAEIDRPAAAVFAYATDPARFSEWQQGVVNGHMEDPAVGAGTLDKGSGTPVVGAKCVTTRRIGGASRRSTSVVTRIEPGRAWAVRGTDGPVRATVEVLVEPLTGARSRLTISVDFTGHGVGKILVPLMVRRQARKEMPENMAALKRRVEAG